MFSYNSEYKTEGYYASNNQNITDNRNMMLLQLDSNLKKIRIDPDDVVYLRNTSKTYVGETRELAKLYMDRQIAKSRILPGSVIFSDAGTSFARTSKGLPPILTMYSGISTSTYSIRSPLFEPQRQQTAWKSQKYLEESRFAQKSRRHVQPQVA